MSTHSDEIKSAFERASKHAKPSIAHTQVLAWMASDDIEALAVLSELIRNPECFSRVKPNVSFDEYKKFFLHYYGRCLREDPKDKNADSRYQAGYDFTQWFEWMWGNQEIPRQALIELRDWLADLYRSADEQLRIAIVHATLEHLFENEEIAQFFESWKDDETLSQARAGAQAWIDGLKRAGIEPPTLRAKT